MQSYLNASAQDTVCVGSRKLYYVTGASSSNYTWNLSGGGSIISTNNDTLEIEWWTLEGNYTLSVFETSRFGCVGDTQYLSIEVKEIVFPFIDGPNTVCPNDPTEFRVRNAKDVDWGNSLTDTIQIFRIQRDTTINVVASTDCGVYVLAKEVKVREKPKVSFNFKPDFPEEETEVKFYYTGNEAEEFRWYINNKLEQNLGTEFYYTFNDSGIYKVKLEAGNSQNCSDSFVFDLIVYPKVFIFIPNVFTPNDDEDNELFKPSIVGVDSFELSIYNRWGGLVFETNSLTEFWDGTFRGKFVPDGDYLYYLKAWRAARKFESVSGTIKVIR
jgi:gliding motility-associated-like protein